MCAYRLWKKLRRTKIDEAHDTPPSALGTGLPYRRVCREREDSPVAILRATGAWSRPLEIYRQAKPKAAQRETS